ncbi:MAG: tetratricopeptide repeat protein [Chloroflexi bacterium]|nr:tetratricopeptide repeat protein [Chloroflexota bacterium]
MLPPTRIIGRRYILHEPLGSGGMGAVYRATDRLTGQAVALKRVAAASGSDQLSTGYEMDFRLVLAQEFKILASLRHPHIISVLDYGFDELRQPYYTMELLDGAATILEAGRGKPLIEQVGLLVQMLQALSYLHRRGVTHRDLKPSNVLVTGGAVRVLDFGLSIAAENRGGETASSTAGTLAYMAPEVLIGGIANALTDLYAVGVMAYELLTGQHPFHVEDVTQLINDILYNAPDTSNLELGAKLALVLERLLAKSPAARYADANEVIRELSEAVGQPLPLETAATRESFLQAARLVGRDDELKTLSDALEKAIAGTGSAWLVAGEGGVGKSRLLEELRALALVRGALVLRGQGAAESGSPYLLWRPALRWLCLLTELDDAQLGALQVLVPDVGTLLDRTLPAEEVDWKAAQSRIIAVIEEVFRRQKQPLVVMLEDLHWADESLDVLARLALIVADLPVLLIGSYRDDERPDLPARLPHMNRLKLERLSNTGIAELSAAMLGDAGRQPQVLDLLQRETEGNVFFLVEVVRVLAEEAGRLDRIGMVTLPMHVFEGGIRQIIQRRLSRVPQEAQPLLRVAATIGRELNLELLRAIEPAANLDRWLTSCADAAVLDVLDGRWRFAHDKLRDGVLADLDDESRRALHERVAATMERLYAGEPEHTPAIAYHYARAGNPAKEEHYAALAGAYLLMSGAYREAIHWLARALALVSAGEGAPTADRRQRQITLRRQIGGARLGLGQYEDARQLFEDNLNACRALSDRRGEADARRSLGDVAQALADYERARECYQKSLEIYREIGDQTGVSRLLNNLGSVAYDLGQLAEAKNLYQQSLVLSREAGSQWSMAGTITSTTQEIPVVTGQPLRDSLSLYQESSRRAPLLEAFERLLTLAASNPKEADALLKEALALFEKTDDRWAHALTLNALGRLGTSAGQFSAAASFLRAALEMAAALPDQTLMLDTLAAIGALFVRRGQPESSVELLSLALHHPDGSDKTQDEAERLLFELQAALPPEQVKAGWERGKTRPLDEAVRDLLAGNELSSGQATA